MAKRYHADVSRYGAGAALPTPAFDVFAFQEMDREKGTPQNDKNIFASITSLMKAQSYELSALPQRRKDPAVYQFNLISVVDADMVRMEFSSSGVEPRAVTSEHYIARYIIRRTPTVSRIRFIGASAFDKAIPEYDALHRANIEWFQDQYKSFYTGILRDANRVDVLLENFRKAVGFYVEWRLGRHYNIKLSSAEQIGIEWRDDQGMPAVTLPSAVPFDRLNADTSLKQFVGKALLAVFKYSGDFLFDSEEIPF
jgi:hypothetical protein